MVFSIPSREARHLCRNVPSKHNRLVSLKYLAGDEYRYSVVVSRKWGNAVKRNRIKRMLREYMRTHREDAPAGSYLIFINRHCDELARDELMNELAAIIHRIH